MGIFTIHMTSPLRLIHGCCDNYRSWVSCCIERSVRCLQKSVISSSPRSLRGQHRDRCWSSLGFRVAWACLLDPLLVPPRKTRSNLCLYWIVPRFPLDSRRRSSTSSGVYLVSERKLLIDNQYHNYSFSLANPSLVRRVYTFGAGRSRLRNP